MFRGYALRNVRRASQADSLKHDITDHITFTLALDRGTAADRDFYMSAAWSIRDRIAERWAGTQRQYREQDVKRVYYLSLEFLMGRTLGNALINLDLTEAVQEALDPLGYRLEDIESMEPDAGLGNGGLGRLAACYLDSMATLEIPGYGYGIRYEHGIFRQQIVEGRQVELPDNWLHDDNPWEIARPDRTYAVKFYGRTEAEGKPNGEVRFRWVDTQDVKAMAYDTPIPGYRNNTVNTLRLWAAKATEAFDLADFIRGDYLAAVAAKSQTETISKVLYPPDDTGSGKELRIKQQYFFVSATIQDIIRRYLRERKTFTDFPDKVQIQLNDTHPAVAIPELMRLLLDEHGLGWNEAWEISRRTFAYTNHTVLPEALETWSIDLFGRLLPRHLQIIEEIDRRLRGRAEERFAGAPDRVERMAILSHGQVRMASLAIAGSHTINGVAALHTRILRERIFHDFYELWPDKFVSVTNGVTQRRWMLKANPPLSRLITHTIGDEWVTDLTRLEELEKFAADEDFRTVWQTIKEVNKKELARVVERITGVSINPAAIMDVQVKRMHEYKRQLLNVLRLVHQYLELRDNPSLDVLPRAVLFAGKAAPTYWRAKQVIKMINCVADLVNRDASVSKKLQVAFLPDYNVSLAEKIFPGSDLSEQISTAGYEASGTGNMKFALNGALTIGTLDGANIEIADAVGKDNIFIFGLDAEDVARRKDAGYHPQLMYETSPNVRRVIDFIRGGAVCPDEPGLFDGIIEDLLEHDRFMLLADFDAYLEAQAKVDVAYRDQDRWTRMSILNVARCGFFSSDRSVKEYAERIWKL
ncbi:MAG: glycogen/starch/alpha-glucan family phosphorylase [Gemmatimonas sp.]|nr:glycogen/starch/alpha-glucan family phosphorylase [Gemmatimonas sp.]